ncbi:MAG: cadherin-like beta sandwich domain-containing protein, partial [Gammaproteobacteria bacterium]
MNMNMNSRGDTCRASRFASATRARFVLPAMLLTMMFTLLAATPAEAFRPSQPQNVALDALSHGLVASWEAPRSDGNYPLQHYQVRMKLYACNQVPDAFWSLLGDTCWYTTNREIHDTADGINVGLATSRQHTTEIGIQGFTLGYQVKAVNTNGESSRWSPEEFVVVNTPFRAILADATGIEGGIRVTWNRQTEFPGLQVEPSGFVTRWRLADGRASWQWTQPKDFSSVTRGREIAGSNTREYNIDGLQNGTAYEVQVAARNHQGRSQWSQPPRRVVAGSGDATLTGISLNRATGDKRTISLAPEFAADTRTYAAEEIPFVDNDNVEFSMSPSQHGSKITIGNSALSAANNTYTHTAAIAEGANTFAFTVTSTSGLSTKNYSVTVTRIHAGLSALQIAAGRVNEVLLSPTNLTAGDNLPFRPAFAPEVRTYDVSVSHHIAELRLRLAAGKL